MGKLLTSLIFFFALVSWAEPCHVQVRQALAEAQQDQGALSRLAKQVGIGSKQLRFLLEQPDLADRTQSLLVAWNLFDQHREELLKELYFRTEATTKYASQVGPVLRFRDWIHNRAFRSPFYRDRSYILSDALENMGQQIPGPLYEDFVELCERIPQEQFLRGAEKAKAALRSKLEMYAESDFDRLRSELPKYYEKNPSVFVGALMVWFAPKNPSFKVRNLKKALDHEASRFFDSLDFIPVSTDVFGLVIDSYFQKRLPYAPKFVEVLKDHLLEMHHDTVPPTFEEFREWMEPKFSEVLTNERNQLLYEWRSRQPRRVVLPDTATRPSATGAIEVDGSISIEPIEEAEEADSDVDVEAIVSEDFVSRVSQTSTASIRQPYRSKGPVRFRRKNSQPDPASQVASDGAEKKRFRFIYSESAQRQKDELIQGNRDLGKRIEKALGLLAQNPWHRSLATHESEGETLKRGDGVRILRSRINQGKAGYRILWHYGAKGVIHLDGFVHHDEGQ